jgi:hypothetical protein
MKHVRIIQTGEKTSYRLIVLTVSNKNKIKNLQSTMLLDHYLDHDVARTIP